MQDASYDRCATIEGKILFSLCKTADTPYSLGVWLAFKYDALSYAELTIDPSRYSDSATFRKDYQCLCFLSKWKGLDTAIDLERVALSKFAASEVQCKTTNGRLKAASVTITDYEPEIFRMRRKIADLLGPFSWFKIEDRCGWGKGATYEMPRSRAQIDRKITELPIHVSAAGLPLLKTLIEADLHWSAAILGTMPCGPYTLLATVFEPNDTCRVTTVDKNAKTNRVIAIEPRGSLFLQKGVGSYFRSRLKTVGVDLNDQGVNQQLASKAILRGLATLDLRAASDTVSKELIYLLLPIDWAIQLDALRSHSAQMPDGSVVRLEKFSSMGNGFTFELESLVFWACVHACAPDGAIHMGSNASVYGDDLICPRGNADRLVAILHFLGFEVNTEKSFTEGSFFESCGQHYFLSEEVTPAYQKEIIDSLSENFRTSNRLLRAANRAGFDLWIDRFFWGAWWQSVRDHQFDLFHFALPNGSEGDDGLLVPYDVFVTLRGPHANRRSFDPAMIPCRVLTLAPCLVPADDTALLAWTFRRGVLTENPFLGEVSSSSRSGSLKRAIRSFRRPEQFQNIWL